MSENAVSIPRNIRSVPHTNTAPPATERLCERLTRWSSANNASAAPPVNAAPTTANTASVGASGPSADNTNTRRSKSGSNETNAWYARLPARNVTCSVRIS